MNRLAVTLLIMFFHGMLLAQGPKVPNKMVLGDIRIKITDGARAEIQKNVNELTKHPKYFNAKVDLANQYFPFIEEAFKKEGVPEDIKYLVIQESGLISDAVSTSDAVGYWQFKDFTAVEVGLRVDRHVDERKNIVSASIGAAKYLKINNGYFDNWLYAIQAYQMGAGGALKVTNKKLYGAKQMTITKKTYWYVKKYLAHKVAYENAVGKSKPSVYLSAYKSGAGKSLKDIAKKFKVNEDELIRYNKWLRKGTIPSDKRYTVVIPDKKLINIVDDDDGITKPKNIFVKKTPSYNQSQSKLFPVIKAWKGSAKYSGSTANINRLPGVIGTNGDKLIDLARKGNLNLSDFLTINDVKIDHKIIEGEVYYFKKKKSKAKVYYHVLHPDETLWSVSQKYGVRLKKLLMKNRITGNEKVKKGRVLWMRHIRPDNVPIVYEKIENSEPIKININSLKENEYEKLKEITESLKDSVKQHVADDSLMYTGESQAEEGQVDYKEVGHIVKKGDTYYNIANRYEVKVLDLVKWNKLSLRDKLSIDQELKIFTPFKNEIETETEQKELEVEQKKIIKYHLVEKGETMYSISRKYGLTLDELKKVNDKTENEVGIGERMKIPVKE